MEDTREAAKRLIEEGLTLVPAHPLGKHPIVNWRMYQERSPDQAEINHWMSSAKYQVCNWAIITGREIVVVDADSEEAEEYVRANLTYTPRTVTTSRGRHFWYRVNPHFPIQNGANPKLNIDVRGNGGVVIAPGSKHSEGHTYAEEIDEGMDGDWRELPFLSAQDLKAISGFNEPQPQEVTGFNVSDIGVPEGTRNNDAASRAGRLIAQGATEEQIIEELLSWDQHNRPPLGRETIINTVRSMLGTDARNKERAEKDYKEYEAEQRIALAPKVFKLGDTKAIPPREWVHGTHYIRKFISVTVAPGGTGKTAITLADAVAMASGKPILGIKSEPRTVWVWNLEDPYEELQRRIAAICQHHEVTQEDLGERLLVNSGRDEPLVIAEQIGGINTLTPAADALTAHIKELGVDVVIVDPFVSSHHLSENDNKAIDLVVKRWGKVADEANCSIELVHHVRKGGAGQEQTVSDARGASSLVDAARHVRRLQRMTADEARKAGIEEAEFWRFTREGDSKDNLAPPNTDSTWRQMVSVELPNGDNVGVAEPWKWPDPFTDISAADLLRVQRLIGEGEYRENSRSKDWAGSVVADVLDQDVSDPYVRTKIKGVIDTWVKNGALRIVELPDKTRHMRKYIRSGRVAHEWEM